MKTYYYIDGADRQKGPMSLEELKSKKIKATTPVWTEGMDDWEEAINLKEFEGIFNTLPPRQKRTTPPPYKKKRNKKRAIIVLSSLLAIVLLTWFIVDLSIKKNTVLNNHLDAAAESPKETLYNPNAINDSATLETEHSAKYEEDNPLQFLKAEGYYNPNFFATKLKINGKVHNTAKNTSYKEVMVRVYFYSRSNKLLGTEDYTMSRIVAPGQYKKFNLKVNKYKNVATIGWDVVSAKVY